MLDRVLPGAFEQAVADADTFFTAEVPMLHEWRFGPEQAAEIEQPVLRMLGNDSLPLFNEADALLEQWLAHSKPSRILGCTHALELMNTPAVAQALEGVLRPPPNRSARIAPGLADGG